jgi:histidyl-tRNA synthetase
MANIQAPRGTQDVFGKEMTKWHVLEDLIRDLCFVYGYDEIRTPQFEHTEVFKRENDSSDVVNKEMYTFTDRGDRSLTLRPEGTAGLIRSYVENKLYASADLPLKLYYIGPCFRYERPQKGRMRIHHQFGVEVVGEKSPLIDAEVIQLGVDFLARLGLKDTKVLINTLGDKESRLAYRDALKKHFEPSLNELCPDCQRRFVQNPLRILDCKVDAAHPSLLSAPDIHAYLTPDSKAYFDTVIRVLNNCEIEIEVSDRLVRGLDYYAHTVFEVVSVNKEMGSQATIFGGGRYDELVEYFGGPAHSGIGFGMGIERLLVALDAEGIDISDEAAIDVYVLSLGKEVIESSYQFAALCRAAGYRTQLDYSGRPFKAQFKSVERKGAKVVLMVGENELKDGKVALKNIATQEQVTVTSGELVHQLDHWLDEDHHCEDHSHGE